MSYADLTLARYSCRHFEDREVPADVLRAVLEAGRLAPSACNKHPTRVIVCDTPELRERAARVGGKFGRDGSVFGAPVVLLVCAQDDAAWHRRYDGMNAAPIDSSIVCDQMMMQATELGLGTCWVCAFDPQVAIDEFDLPEGLYPYHMLPMGYPAETIGDAEARAARTIPMDEFVLDRA